MNSSRKNSMNSHGRSRTDLEPKVFEAEFVTEQPDEPHGARSQQLIAWVVAAARRLWRADRAVRFRSVARYRLRMAPRDVVRLLWFVLRGHGRWAMKAWTFFTYGDLRSDARAARIAGDVEARREAQDAIRAMAKARWAKCCAARPTQRWCSSESALCS